MPEYWSGLPFPSSGDGPDPGIEPRSPALQAEPQREVSWKPWYSFHFPQVPMRYSHASLQFWHFCWALLVYIGVYFSSVQSLSPVRLCHPRGDSLPGFPVHHQLPEPTQTHIHRVSDAIQPSHLPSSPSPPAFNLSQHQSLFQWVSTLHQVAKSIGVAASASVLPLNIQGWFPLELTSLISLQSSISQKCPDRCLDDHQPHPLFSTSACLS